MGDFRIILPFNLTNGTTADANEVMANYNKTRDQHNDMLHGTTGHGHTGVDGDGPKLTATGLAAGSVGDTQINWGTGAGQVSAADIPIADAGNYYPTDNVEAALQEISQGTRATSFQLSRGAANPLTTAHAALTAPRTATYPDATGNVPVLPTAATTETGTGAMVRQTAPTITTPVIGDFTNAQHTHQNAAGGGTLDGAAIATGVTGSGPVVKQTAPTITTPTITDLTNMQHTHANAAGGGQIAHGNLTGIGTNTHAQIDSHISATAAHGTTGAIVGTTDTQTLSNKTLTGANAIDAFGTLTNSGVINGTGSVSGSMSFSGTSYAATSAGSPNGITSALLDKSTGTGAVGRGDAGASSGTNVYNCSSFTRNGVGDYTITYGSTRQYSAAPMAIPYAAITSTVMSAIIQAGTALTTSVRVGTLDDTGIAIDSEYFFGKFAS